LIREILGTMSRPIAAPLTLARQMRDWADRGADPALLWSLESAANDISQHASFFTAPESR
jgi:hypothetical protein